MTPTSARLALPLARLALAAALAAGAGSALAAGAANHHEADVRRAAASFSEHEKVDVAKLSRVLQQLVQDRALLEPFLARDREKLLAAARPSFEILKEADQVTHWYFITTDGKCFLRVHNPAVSGDAIDRDTLKQAMASGDLGFGKELGKTAFALRVVRPIRTGGKVVGYMELGEEIDHFFERMKQQTGDDFGLLADKQHIDRKELARVRNDDRWDERPDVVLINSTMWDEKRIQLGVPLAKLPAEGVFAGEWQDEGKSYVGGAFPVKNAAGHVVGALFVRHQIAGPRPGAAEKTPTAAPAK
jgi:hypothetical protein